MPTLDGILDPLGSPAAVTATQPIVLALVLTLGLTLVIGITYQVTHTGPLYTQGFVHTLVLVGLVASVVLRIVGENAAAALAIFGAFSIIRFRNAVPETRDVGFIFLSMVIGLATGAGQYQVAILTTLVACAVMFALWRFNLFAPEKTSHILRVRLTNDIDFSTAFQEPFEQYLDRAVFHRVDSVQGGMLTEVTYGVRLREGVSPRDFLTALQTITGNNRVLLISAGPELADRL